MKPATPGDSNQTKSHGPTSALKAAQRYVRRGWRVVPIPKGQKAPRLKGWQSLIINKSSLPQHFPTGSNIGVLLGEPSGWLIDVDLDHPLAVELADQFLPATSAVFGRRGKQRSHWLYRVTAPVNTTKRQTADKKMIIELRSSGCQTVFPPSWHPSGERIKWFADGQPTEIAPASLLAAVNAIADEVQRQLTLQPARQYLSELPPAVSGQNGHDSTYHAACVLVDRFKLNRHDALMLLGEYNESCEPPWSNRDLRHKVEDALKQASAGDNSLVPVLVCMADVKPEPIQWLWPGRIAMGKLSLIAGDPGLGKSLTTLDMAMRVSCGLAWPDNPTQKAPLGGIVLLNAEDDAADTIRPRLDAAGADVTKIMVLQAVECRNSRGKDRRAVDLSRDIAQIEAAISQTPECRLVVVDPVSAYLGGKDSHNNAQVRSLLAPLSEVAGRHCVAVVAVTHLRKGEGQAIYRAMGSLGFAAAARAVWAVVKDDDDESRRLFLPVKNNIAPDGTGLAFRVTGQPNGPASVEWEPEPVTISADAAMARRDQYSDRGGAIAEACDFLRQALSAGPRATRDVEEEAREAHGITKRTLDRARKRLGVEPYREKVPGTWLIRFTGESSGPVGVLGTVGSLAALPDKYSHKPRSKAQQCQQGQKCSGNAKAQRQKPTRHKKSK